MTQPFLQGDAPLDGLLQATELVENAGVAVEDGLLDAGDFPNGGRIVLGRIPGSRRVFEHGFDPDYGDQLDRPLALPQGLPNGPMVLDPGTQGRAGVVLPLEYRGLSSNGTGMYAKGCRPGAATPPQVQRSGPVARAVPRL